MHTRTAIKCDWLRKIKDKELKMIQAITVTITIQL